eukprot:Em0020g819a
MHHECLIKMKSARSEFRIICVLEHITEIQLFHLLMYRNIDTILRQRSICDLPSPVVITWLIGSKECVRVTCMKHRKLLETTFISQDTAVWKNFIFWFSTLLNVISKNTILRQAKLPRAASYILTNGLIDCRNTHSLVKGEQDNSLRQSSL